MFGGLNRLLLAAAVAAAALATALADPAAALAGCSQSTSAVNVYTECLPSGGGGNPSGPAASRSGSGNGGPGSTRISGAAATAIKRAGKDSRALALVERTGPRGLLRSGPSSLGSEPSAVGSAFNLGSSPGVFLIALAGSALLLLAGSGLRVWHQRRP